MLPAEEQQVFEVMSVFVGGLDTSAAVTATGATLAQLLSLADRGLLRRWSPDHILEALLHRQATSLLHHLAQLLDTQHVVPQGVHPSAVTGGVMARYVA
jgi:hypothetical protein